MLMIDGRNFFDPPVNNDLKTYSIRKVTTGCLLNYPNFKEHYRLIAIDLSIQQVLDADPKAMQQINFTGNLE